MALTYMDYCVSKHSYCSSHLWSFSDPSIKDYISHDDGTYTYFSYGKYRYRYRYDPVPGVHKSHWYRKKNSKHLRYKHFLNLSISNTYPISYEDESKDDISFKKVKFKKCYWDVVNMKDYDQSSDDYRKHMSWKSNKCRKKEKQWM